MRGYTEVARSVSIFALNSLARYRVRMTQDEMVLEIHRLRARVRHLTTALEDIEQHGLRSDLQPVAVGWTFLEWTQYLRSLETSLKQRTTMFLGPVRKESSGTMKAVKP